MARPNTIHTCYVCVNIDCAENGSPRLLEMLSEQLAGSSVQVKEYVCFGACDFGPNIVMYPEGTLYSGVHPGDVDELVAHATGGERVDRLVDTNTAMLADLVLMLLDSGME